MVICDRLAVSGGRFRHIDCAAIVSELHVVGVTYIDIEEEAPRSGIGLAFRADERSPALKNVMKVVRVVKLSN